MIMQVIRTGAGTPPLEFTLKFTRRKRPFYVPNRLPELPAARALATVTLPQWVKWSPPFRDYDMAKLRDRARVYEMVITEGGPADIARHIDAVLLAEVWPELILPAEIRAAWSPVFAAWEETAA